MSKKLVIVESPAKAKTLGKILGKGYNYKASMGHVRDLPRGQMGVDTEHDFQPKYVIPKVKTKLVNELKSAAKDSAVIYLATDPDREGEAIAWHIARELEKNGKKIFRILFNEFTSKAIQEAIASPLELNQERFESQQARRILDRLVGYQLSPLE